MATSYDEVAYTSHSYPDTQIAHQYIVGRVLGLAPCDIHKARVLELGCASGGNLVPMAAAYPGSVFLGIDQSERQIAVGRQLIAEAGLKNAKIEAMSILDFPAEMGEFDYIVCHGVFSWVAKPVQDAILGIIQRHLSESGLAVVSYNTLPGWNAVRSVRDMMLYHAKFFAEPERKVKEARSLLKFMRDSTATTGGPYGTVLDTEQKLLARQGDYYLYHDHLEEVNDQFYLYEFMERAAACDLSYVGDSDLPSMFLGNMSKEVVSVLGATNDQIRQEQYMDFVRNRRFRKTILCRRGQKTSLSITPDRLEPFYLRALIKPTPDNPVDLSGIHVFKGPGDFNLTTRTPETTAVVRNFVESTATGPVRECDLVATFRSRHPEYAVDRMLAAFREFSVRLLFAGAISLSVDPWLTVTVAGERPKALALARHQVRLGLPVTNERRETVGLEPVARLFLGQLDGSRTKPELALWISKQIAGGALKIQSVTPGAVVSEQEHGQIANGILDMLLKQVAGMALLEA